MRVLAVLCTLTIAVATIAPVAGLATSQAADEPPPNSTDHGLNNSTFHTLWSRDVDGSASNRTTAMGQLAARTDVPLDTPPRAVERWNRGDLGDFPATDDDISYHPPDADLENGTVLEDAFVEVFAVQPSTRATLTPDRQPHYVAPDGTVLAVADFRVDDPNASDTVEWTGSIESVTLRVDGQPVTSTDGSHTPTLDYHDLPGRGRHTLTVEATMVARPILEQTDCPPNATGPCWTGDVPPVERLTVHDQLAVVEYDLDVGGSWTRYPDGDVGLFVHKAQPWLGYRTPDGDVRGVWRFYAARDPAWDRLVRSTDGGRTTRPSPLTPLRVHAYPIETGPTPSPRGQVSILSVLGESRQPPTLPAPVNLDVLTEPYTASYGLVTRLDHAPNESFSIDAVEAIGLVRGVTDRASPADYTEFQVNRSNLTLAVTDRTADTVTVRATLKDAATGAPIDTSSRRGYVVVGNRTVNTSTNGTATVTLPRRAGVIAARYEPAAWWWRNGGWTGAETTAYVGGTIIPFLGTLYQFAVPLSLFGIAAFLIDRFTGWALWPPWRNL